MSTCCKCQTSTIGIKPVWRDGRVVKLCSLCVRKTKVSEKARAKGIHLEAWNIRPAVIVKQKALEDMTKKELEAEIARLSA